PPAHHPPFGRPAPGPSPPSGGLVDPLDMFSSGAKPAPPAPTVPDSGSELFTPFTPPQARPEAAGKVPAPGRPTIPQPRAPIAPSGLTARVAPQAPVAPPPPVTPSQPVSAPPAGSHEQVLLRAFLQGAGIPGSQSAKSLTPDTMEAIGQLLREAVRGRPDLLGAGGAAK